MALSPDDVRRLAENLLDRRHFAGELPLCWRHEPAERLRWEVFQGRLLDEAHTRQERTFESWNIHVSQGADLSPEPILSLKFAADANVLHVVRGVESYVWEGYDSGGGVYLTRERRKWVRELIASVPVTEEAIVRDEVAHALGRAVTGTRLPLTPSEAPLPAFSFGQLWYGPAGEGARRLEFHLRSRPVEDVVATWSQVRGAEVVRQLRRLFQDVSLSPYTDFVDRVLGFLAGLVQVGTLRSEEVVDFESWLLRLVARHLTAYDLVTFHHRGANYPDALLLDAVLGDYVARVERDPELFDGGGGRLRRRALRQAYLLRRQYENHLVPDVPTSPGEHARVYPDSYPRVPQEQVLQTTSRQRRLFADKPLCWSATVQEVLARAVEDLVHAEEREELGAATYLDRPFGGGKAAVEPDGTLLLASVAYSRSIARRRLGELGVTVEVGDLAFPGLPVERIGGPVRASTLSLSDAARAASDFVFRHTLPGSVRALVELFDFGKWAKCLAGRILVARDASGPGLAVYDERWQRRLLIEPRYHEGYASRRGLEWPAAGVRVVGIGTDEPSS